MAASGPKIVRGVAAPPIKVGSPALHPSAGAATTADVAAAVAAHVAATDPHEQYTSHDPDVAAARNP